MGNCLVNRLMATVDNPNLPILETMQQFTLDAITASGNSSMTDAQKLALNHFFYQIGAIDNNALWQKMVSVGLPVICGDNLNKAMVNYVDYSVSPSAFVGSFANHGVYPEGTNRNYIATYNGNAYDLSVLSVFTLKNVVYKQSNKYINGVYGSMKPVLILDANTNYNMITYQGVYYYFTKTSEVEAAAAVSLADNIVFKRMSDGELVTVDDIEMTGRINNDTFTDDGIVIGGTADNPTGIAIAAKNLTVSEMDKLIAISIELKNAFAPES